MGLGTTEAPGPQPWWDKVLAPKALPEPTEDQEAVKEAIRDSGQAFAAVLKNQQSWRRAYNVPGVTTALKHRTEPLRALSLSGGGVRSACVAMGAMQVFSKPSSATGPAANSGTGDAPAPTLLDGLDYVISVSGGGYAAGARLLAVQGQLVDPNQKREKPGRLRPKRNIANISQRFEDGSAEFDHIRRGSSYLADSPLGLVRALTEVLKNLVASLAIIFSVPVIAGSVAGFLLADVPIAAFPPVSGKSTAAGPDTPSSASLVTHPAAYWALGVFAVFGVVCTVFVLITEWRSNSRCSERRMAHALGMARASAVFALVIFTLTIALPALMRLCSAPSNHTPSSAGSAFAALSGVVGVNYVAALIAIVWRDRHKLKSAGAQSTPRLLKTSVTPGGHLAVADPGHLGPARGGVAGAAGQLRRRRLPVLHANRLGRALPQRATGGLVVGRSGAGLVVPRVCRRYVAEPASLLSPLPGPHLRRAARSGRGRAVRRRRTHLAAPLRPDDQRPGVRLRLLGRHLGPGQARARPQRGFVRDECGLRRWTGARLVPHRQLVPSRVAADPPGPDGGGRGRRERSGVRLGNGTPTRVSRSCSPCPAPAWEPGCPTRTSFATSKTPPARPVRHRIRALGYGRNRCRTSGAGATCIGKSSASTTATRGWCKSPTAATTTIRASSRRSGAAAD